MDSAFKDTCENHNFLETLHLLELGGCSDKDDLRYIGSIRSAVQPEPRSRCGICGASSGKSTRAQEVPRQLQPGCNSFLPQVFLPAERKASSCGGERCYVWLRWCSQEVTASSSASHQHPSHSASSRSCKNMPPPRSQERLPDLLSAPQLSLTLHLHFSSSHLSLIGPSSLLSLVLSSSRRVAMTPHCLGHYSPPEP